MAESRRPAIVLGANFAGLGIVHSLGPNGVPCRFLDTNWSIPAASRFATFHRVPDPEAREEDALARVFEIVERTGDRPVLFAASDGFTAFLARHGPALQAVADVCSASWDTVDLMLDKHRFAEWARGKSLSAPETVSAAGFHPGSGPAFPVVAKPRSRLGTARQAQRGGAGGPPPRFTLIQDEDQWRAYRATFPNTLSDVVIQGYVAGPIDSMFSVGVYIDRRQVLLGLFVGRKLRGRPPHFGNAVVGQNDAVPAAVLDEVAQLVAATGLTGIAEFEYKRDAETGVFRLLEVNPRAWHWIAVTRRSKTDIPWIAYRDLCGAAGPSVARDDAVPGTIKYLELFPDLIDFLCHGRRHRRQDRGFRAWRRSLAADRLVIAEINAGDWSVGLLSLIARPPRIVLDAIRKG